MERWLHPPKFGDVTLQAVWPRPDGTGGDPGESAPNNASVVLVAEVAGLRILLTATGQLRNCLAIWTGICTICHSDMRRTDL